MYTTMKDWDGNKWTFAASGNSYLIIEKETADGAWEKRVFDVVPDKNGFIYRLLKTRISANGGARGLYDFMRQECSDGLSYSAFTAKILFWAWDSMKQSTRAKMQ